MITTIGKVVNCIFINIGEIKLPKKGQKSGITIQRLSPRKKGSIWSELNKERCRRMEKQGKMLKSERNWSRTMSIDKRYIKGL